MMLQLECNWLTLQKTKLFMIMYAIIYSVHSLKRSTMQTHVLFKDMGTNLTEYHIDDFDILNHKLL